MASLVVVVEILTIMILRAWEAPTRRHSHQVGAGGTT
jgi:hypothetical protein